MNETIVPSPEQASRQPVRKDFPAEWLALAVILIAIIGLVTAYAWLNRSWFISEQSRLPKAAAEAIVGRGSQLIGMTEPAGAWSARLATGEVSLADYLLRIFVSPDYLSQSPDDAAFVSDASLVLTGTLLSDPDKVAAVGRLAESGSRLVYLNNLLAQEGYTSRIALSADPTRIRTLTLVNDRPATGSEVVGLMPITAEARLTGSDARLKIFADGQVRRSEALQASDPMVQNNYTVEWDTRLEQPGSHQLAFLLLTSDGRGNWQDLKNYTVPKVTTLQTGQVLAGSQQSSQTAWYLIPAQDGQAQMTIVGTNQALDLQLLDLHARVICRTEGVAGQTAALRGKTLDSDCYVRIASGTASQSKYKLAAAMAVASPTDNPGRLLGVLKRQDQQILVQDETGLLTWQDAAKYLVDDPTGRLSKLQLTLADGSLAKIAESFDAEKTQYGLYVTAETSQLQLAAQVMEGSAASMKIELTTDTGARLALQPGMPVPLSLSENRLQLAVTAFDGSLRTYDISILRPPHTGGYHQTLEQFPFAYRSSLWLMHVRWPAWQFQAAPAGVSWPAFITAQDKKDLSLVSSFSVPASWIEPGSPVYDGKSWKAATAQVIAYYADPRNFLNDTDVFQFEKLTFNSSTHTRQGLETILADTFMARGNAKGIDYAAILVEAGERAGISPYYLASRILQEMGRNGESALSSGTLADYEGYYNFYNIGSTPNPSVPNGAVINGARYAKFGREADKGVITEDETVWLLPWTNPKDAIIGGAIWIAKSYVQIGQDTLYLQKFDLVPAGGYYTHQYAQNIQMAWSEARNTRKGYLSLGLLNQAFVFQIPVFSDLPTAPTTLPAA